MEKRKCPKCGKYYSEFPALSREDNKTLICPTCGEVEAFEDYLKILRKEDKYEII